MRRAMLAGLIGLAAGLSACGLTSNPVPTLYVIPTLTPSDVPVEAPTLPPSWTPSPLPVTDTPTLTPTSTEAPPTPTLPSPTPTSTSVLTPTRRPPLTWQAVYARRASYPDDRVATFKAGAGDLFVSQPGSVAPPPDPDQVLVTYNISYDQDGFRRPIMTASTYPIITFGTSVTEGVRVAVPWPDMLAAELNTPVQNMAVSTYNPPDYARVMTAYGTRQPRKWVIMSLWEGNGMINALGDAPEDAYTPPPQRRQWLLNLPGTGPPDYGPGPWKYPIEVQLGPRTAPFAFFEFYLWWLNGELADYQRSAELAAVRHALTSIQADAGNACVMLVNIPIKPHVYLPFVTDPDHQDRVLESAYRMVLDADNRLDLDTYSGDYARLLSRIDNQSRALESMAGELGVHYVDMTGPLREAAQRGEETYHLYDTHWNQRAHEIAGRAVADYILAHPECGVGG